MKQVNKKSCRRCGAEKPLAEFYKDKNTKSGYSTYCKECVRKLAKGYRESEIGKAKIREYVNGHKEEHKVLAQKYRQEHPNMGRLANKKHYNNNKIKILEAQKKYRLNYYKSDKYKKRYSEWYKKCYVRGRKELTDFYLKTLMVKKYKIWKVDINQTMIEQERKIQTIRLKFNITQYGN